MRFYHLNSNFDMGTKRKAEDAAAVPESIKMKHADGNAPFAVYFPSGFDPEKAAAECEWEAFEHEKTKNQYAVVARTVSLLSKLSDDIG